MVLCYVYIITHRETGTTYVGFTRQRPEVRWRQHRSPPSKFRGHLFYAIRKYGKEAFSWEVYGSYTEDEAGLAVECELIWLIKDMGVPSYNATSGGEHFKHTEETKQKMRGRVVSEKTRKILSDLNRGQKVSEETKQKLRISSTGKKHTEMAKEKCRGSKIGNTHAAGHQNSLGYRHTEDAKRRIAEALRGRPVSQETRAKISKANKKT